MAQAVRDPAAIMLHLIVTSELQGIFNQWLS
jgi:hypothetical protein